MCEASPPVGVHLVGSIPAETAEAAFRLAAETLGDRLNRIPDGEVGERDTWIRWQYSRLTSSKQIEQLKKDSVYTPMPPLGLVDSVNSADEIALSNLGYADAAIDSWHVFADLVEAGTLPSDVRFQVGMPTPLSVSLLYVDTESRQMFEQAYGQALAQELANMLRSIPADRLAIQWETVAEFALLEGLMDNHLEGDLLDVITSRVSDLVDLVPLPAEAGLHLCYGDSGHKHFCEPRDAGFLADVMAGVFAKSNRKVDWIHLPVPKERDDEAYFAPLASVDIPESTELYLGLVHQTGGVGGTQRRIDAAATTVSRFGVATECGLGRRDPGTIAALMAQHAAVAGKRRG